MDPTDRNILAPLQTDASLSNQDLADAGIIERQEATLSPEKPAGQASADRQAGNVDLAPQISSPLPDASKAAAAARREDLAGLVFAGIFTLALVALFPVMLEGALADSAAGKLHYFVGKSTRRILLREGHAFEFWLRNWGAFAFCSSMATAMLAMTLDVVTSLATKKDTPRPFFVKLGALGAVGFSLSVAASALLLFFYD